MASIEYGFYQTLLECTNYVGAVPVSFSRVQSLLSCPYQWKLNYIDRIHVDGKQDTQDIVIGKFLHKVAEVSTRLCEARKYTLKLSDYQRAWGVVKFNEKYPNKYISVAEEKLFENTFAILKRVHDYANKANAVIYPEIKMGITYSNKVFFNLPWKGYLWVSIIDALILNGNKSIIVDYKSHNSSNNKFSEKEDIQMKLYAYIEFLRNNKISEVETKIAYFGDANIVTTNKFTREELPMIEREATGYLQEYLDRLKAPTWDPVRAEHCEWCKYGGYCVEKT